jgi:hypothetical protein
MGWEICCVEQSVGISRKVSNNGLIPTHHRPLIAGLAGRMLALAYYEAQYGASSHLDPSAKLQQCRQVSAAAIRWIRARTDWTRIPLDKGMALWNSPAPPFDLRADFALSRDWCCRLLDLDPTERLAIMARQAPAEGCNSTTWSPSRP